MRDRQIHTGKEGKKKRERISTNSLKNLPININQAQKPST